MSPRLEREAAADDVAEYAVANHIGLRDFSPIRPSIPCQRPPATRAHVVTLDAVSVRPTDADCAVVLDKLVEAGELDDERINEMLDDAAARRIDAPRVPNRARRKLLAAMKSLIDACDLSTDQSTLLQRAKADAFTAWYSAGGSL